MKISQIINIDQILYCRNVIVSHQNDPPIDLMEYIFLQSLISPYFDQKNDDILFHVLVSDTDIPNFIFKSDDFDVLNIVKTDIPEKIKINKKRCILIAPPAKVLFFFIKHKFSFDNIQLLLVHDLKKFLLNPCYHHQCEYLILKIRENKRIILLGNHISTVLYTLIQNRLQINFKFCKIKKNVSTQKNPELY
jgi:hypothetical protein